jgi:hypothetical protein
MNNSNWRYREIGPDTRAERPVPVWRIFLSETGGARLSKERPHERSSKEPQRNDACQDDDYDQEDAQLRHRRSVPAENLPHFDRRSLSCGVRLVAVRNSSGSFAMLAATLRTTRDLPALPYPS